MRAVGDFLERISDPKEAAEAPLNVQFGEQVIEIRTCCPESTSVLRSTFSHLLTEKPAQKFLTFFGSEHASIAPRIGWNWTSTRFQDETGSAHFLSYYNAIFAHDHKLEEFALVSRNHCAEDLSRREILRLLLQPIFSLIGLDVIHGATLGTKSEAVLLAGRGGAGKSTIVSAGVRDGLFTTGEDFLLVDSTAPDTRFPYIYSLFSTAKLVPSSPSAESFLPGPASDDGKCLVDLNQFAASVVPKQQIVAAGVIQVGSHSSIGASTHERFAEAVLPHSAPLTYQPKRLTEFINNRFRLTPFFDIVSGPDLNKTLDLLKDLVKA